jgi:hypothetical protein
VKVRFLRAKRYPHPDGLKRRVDEIVDVEDAVGVAWAAVGLVEPVVDPDDAPVVAPEAAQATTEPPAGRSKASKARKKGR